MASRRVRVKRRCEDHAACGGPSSSCAPCSSPGAAPARTRCQQPPAGAPRAAAKPPTRAPRALRRGRRRLRRGHRPGALRRGRRPRRRRRRPLRARGRERDRARRERDRRPARPAPAPAAPRRASWSAPPVRSTRLARSAPDRGRSPSTTSGRDSRARVRREPADQLARRQRLGQRVRLAGPEVEAVGVAALAGRGAQRRRDVVDVGVAERRAVGVLALEAVDDPARGAAGERARQAGRAVAGDRRAVRRGRSPPPARA